MKDVLIVTLKIDTPHSINLKFLTALINSRALHFYYRTTFKTLHVQSGELSSLPLPSVDSSDKKSCDFHDRIILLVEQIIDAKNQLSVAQTEGDKTFLENKCANLDRQIDNLVYQLYGLTEAEIRIVEGSSK